MRGACYIQIYHQEDVNPGLSNFEPCFVSSITLKKIPLRLLQLTGSTSSRDANPRNSKVTEMKGMASI